MDKQKEQQKDTYKLKREFCLTAIILLMLSFRTYSCGGGVVPYVPTQSGASGASTASSQFFIFEKGVATDLFNVKKHQPIFRNIILTGNERKKNKPKMKPAESDSLDVALTDSTAVAKDEEMLPILNIHRLH